MKYKYYSICVLLFSSLITSCAKKEETSLSSVEPISSLEGLWNAPCTYGARANTILTGGGSFTASAEFFSDQNCSTPYFYMSTSGSYSSGNVQNLGFIQLGEVDWTYASYEITPQSVTAANEMNTHSLCGFTNWSNGVTKSILGATCGSETMPTNGQTEYDIFQYTLDSSLTEYGILPGDLLFGSPEPGYDGSTPSNRPQNLDATFLFRR